MGYDNGKLELCGQPLAGARKWSYTDTGGEAVSVYEGAGYFADAKNYGVKVGDSLEIVSASSTVYRGRFTTVQDTGGTQGTVTLDTGLDIPG